MKIETKRMKEILKPLKAVSGKNSNIHFTHNAISAKKDDVLISISMEDGEMEEDLYGSFDMSQLIKIVNAIPDEKVTLTVKDYRLLIKSKSTLAEIVSKDEETTDEVAEILSEMEYDWVEIPEGFVEALKIASDVASKDLRDGAISCVAITDSNIQASNNVKAVVIDMDIPVKGTILINSPSVKKMAVDDISHMSVSDNFLHLYSDVSGATQTFIRIEDDFPDIAGSVASWKPSKSAKVQKVTFSKESVKICKDLIPFCEGREEYEKNVLVTFGDKFIEFHAKNEESSITKKIENSTGISGVEFLITPTSLSQLLVDTTCSIFNDKLFFKSDTITYVIGI